MAKSKRIKWIDCIKAVAILAVVINHGFLVVYSNIQVAYMTFFSVSVSVFFMASGYTQHLSNKNKNSIELIKVTLKRIAGILVPYIIVCLVYSTYYSLTFVKEINFLSIWERFARELWQFSLEGTFYFVPLYVLVTLISPLLSKLIVLSETKFPKYKIAILGSVLVSLLVMGLSILGTTPEMYPNKYVLGATYLAVVFMGMLMSCTKVEEIIKKNIFFIIAIVIIGGYGVLIYDSIEYFRILNIPNGNAIKQINPPGLIIIGYSLLVFVLLANIFRKLEESRKVVIVGFMDMTATVGKATLYIYFYHYLVSRFILDYVWNPPVNIVIRICILLLMFFVPLIGKCIYDVIKKQFIRQIMRITTKRGTI